MVQSRFAIRGWLGVVACVAVLGAGAVFVHRTGMANRGEAPLAAADAVPKVDEPAVTSPISGVASSGAAITAEEELREASWREAREATIRVQQRLRAEQQARKAAQQQQEAAKNERCVDGQRMKRVENGWVQAGNC